MMTLDVGTLLRHEAASKLHVMSHSRIVEGPQQQLYNTHLVRDSIVLCRNFLFSWERNDS